VDLDVDVDELYALPPDEFTPRRDELAATAREDGDADLAKAVKALRKPTAAAALMNQLARAEPDSLADYLDLGERLRDAQASLAGDELRRLGQERQRAAAALVRRAVMLADGPVSPAQRGELDATLLAAVADPAAGAAVVSGVLTRSLAYAGLGEVDITAATATPLSPVPPSARSAAGARRDVQSEVGAPSDVERRVGRSDGSRVSAAERLIARREEAAARLAAAADDVRAAERAVADQLSAEQEAERTQAAAEAEVEELREALTRARFAVRAAQQQLGTVKSDRIAAEKAVATAAKARDKARRQLDLLGDA
jgi:hypothetical protein